MIIQFSDGRSSTIYHRGVGRDCVRLMAPDNHTTTTLQPHYNHTTTHGVIYLKIDTMEKEGRKREERKKWTHTHIHTNR
ncbi:hypothetical protein Pmani_009811 [Petrolisthes manimaculis]|uniref:Uncharacterized protein n=1 Tax=Petrolisthes manimaculis TaxID=1843537 RepID=A0AAE1UCI9_9EUCA|nr:hypothetical protein Pmani_009811 [Petrolisthes manimaculis]